jgi:hypothetical protein
MRQPPLLSTLPSQATPVWRAAARRTGPIVFFNLVEFKKKKKKKQNMCFDE